jgi:hypothetical protein
VLKSDRICGRRNGLNVTLDAQLVADVKAIAAAVKGVVPAATAA